MENSSYSFVFGSRKPAPVCQGVEIGLPTSSGLGTSSAAGLQEYKGTSSPAGQRRASKPSPHGGRRQWEFFEGRSLCALLVEPSGEPWTCSQQWGKMKSWGSVMVEDPVEPGQENWGPGLAPLEFLVPKMGKYIFHVGGGASVGSFPACVTVLPWSTGILGTRSWGECGETWPSWGKRKAEGGEHSGWRATAPGQGSLRTCQPCSPGQNLP